MSEPTRISITIDTEFSIGGAFSNPEKYKPVAYPAVLGEINGREHGLGFLLETFEKYNISASFFIECANYFYFGDEPMQSIVRRIQDAGQDMQLHVHPCWLSFNKDKDIGDLKTDLKKCTADSKYAVANFKKFIELKENLHWYWHNANEAQKKSLAEILVLNCVVRGRDIRSISWKSPLADVPKSPRFYRGGASCHSIEPYLAKLWNVYVNTDTTAILEYKEDVDGQTNFDAELLLKITD